MQKSVSRFLVLFMTQYSLGGTEKNGDTIIYRRVNEVYSNETRSRSC
jgi:hypothetical protein